MPTPPGKPVRGKGCYHAAQPHLTSDWLRRHIKSVGCQPVVQGRGRRLFPDGFEADRLRVVQVAGFDSGVTLLHYAAR